MNSELIESIAEATDTPLSPLAKLQLRADNLAHRLRASMLRRWDRHLFPRANAWLGETIDANRSCNAAILSSNPPVFLVPIGGIRPLWMVESFGSFLPERRALFFLPAYWSLEYPAGVELIRKSAERHHARFPNHNLVFLCNTAEEQRLLDAAGLEAIALNHNQLVSEKTFRPLDDAIAAYEAVYNAKIARWKRHHLAGAIDRLLYVAYRCPNDMSRSAGRAYIQRMLARSLNHQLANTLVDGLPMPLSHEKVNQAYNQASVGLCLSPAEGAMYASIEYLLAGLPVVTTPSRGGRDVFFDADFCITVEPDPRAVRDAVVALRNRKIPRSTIRTRTLERIEAARLRSLILIDNLLARHGVRLKAAAIWPPARGVNAIVEIPIRSHIENWRGGDRALVQA